MMTPQEVSQHAFAKASFGGYNMAMVDEFLDALTVDYTALYKENAVLKNKMKVLVDKLDEYRATDESMRKAFLLAQKTADEIVAQAEAQKAELMRTAEGEARAKLGSLRQEVESEQYRLTAARNATAAYVGKLRDLHQNELDYISNLSRLSAPAPGPVETAAHEIESTMQKMMDAEPSAQPEYAEETAEQEERCAAETAEGSLYAELLELNITPGQSAEVPDWEPEDDDADNTSPTRRIDFENLKFGKDYEIK
ncbi:MAG: DivIVA domain-containing protein [Pseudoflavonifractor sp.]